MKNWKKLSLLLCMCFAFSGLATACGDGAESSSSVDEQTSSSSSSSSNEKEEVDDSIIADIYLGLMATTLTTSNSVKISFEITNEELLQTGIIQSNTEWEILSGTAVLSKTEGDDFNAKIDLSVTSMEELLQPEEKCYYYLDGIVYEYYSDTNTYDQYNQSLESVLENAIQSLTGGEYTLEALMGVLFGGMGGSLDNLDMDDLSLEGLKESFADIAEIESEVLRDELGKYTGLWITIDGTEKAGETFDFFDSLDEESTYADLLDYPLSLIDPDWSTQKILDELFLMRNDEVRDAVEKLDNTCKEKTKKSLQEHVDSVLKNETVKEVVEKILPDRAESILNFKIAEFLEKESSFEKKGEFVKYGDLHMDDLAGELTQQIVEIADKLLEFGIDLESIGFDPSDATFSMFISMVESMLKKPAFEDMTEDDLLYKLLEEVKALDVTEATGRLDMSVSTSGVESIKIVANLTANREKETSSIMVGADAELLISEFSKDKLTIALPENATLNEIVYVTCEECEEKNASVSYREEEQAYYCDDCFASIGENND